MSQVVQKATSNGSDSRVRRLLFMLVTLVVVFLAARIAIRAINNNDYLIYSAALNAVLNNQNPYLVQGYFTPPWTLFVLMPLAGQPIETWLALTVALFVVFVLDVGQPTALIQLVHPVFITLIASSNPDWILTGTGLWLLSRWPQGWGRGLAWIFLASKPQTNLLLLVFDGLVAIRDRDWKAVLLAGSVAVTAILVIPPDLSILNASHPWSLSVYWHYGVSGAALMTVLIIVLRWTRRRDYKTLGLLLTHVWTPFSLQYHYVVFLFAMRNAGLLRNVLYLAVGFGLALLTWQNYKTIEHLGMAAMLVLTAVMAPPEFGARESSPASA